MDKMRLVTYIQVLRYLRKGGPSSLLIACLFAMGGCLFEADSLSFRGVNPNTDEEADTESPIPPIAVANFHVQDDQIVILGNHLEGVQNILVTGPDDFEESFSIESQSSSEIIARATRNFSFIVGTVFSLVVTDAYGSEIYTFDFELEDGQISANHLSSMGANDGDVLVFDPVIGWSPSPLSGLHFEGTWDARTVGEGGSGDSPSDFPQPGDFWIVSDAGSTSLDGIDNWSAGD